MIERPILFSGPMVKAILAGEKWQTRRVMKTPPVRVEDHDSPYVTHMQRDGSVLKHWYVFDEDTAALLELVRPAVRSKPTKSRIRVAKSWNARKDRNRWSSDEVIGLCPYGLPGDRLWVREAWARTVAAGVEFTVFREGDNRTDYGGPWKPGIHLRRTDARLVLDLANVRFERLQDITAADAIAEGIQAVKVLDRKMYAHCDGLAFPSAVDAYADLWDSLNDKRGLGWATNPWVWVVEFKRGAEQRKAA